MTGVLKYLFLNKRGNIHFRIPVWMEIACILLCSGSIFFSHIGALDADLMEARNFVTAREMMENGSWWIPTMNKELRLEKPPLPTWLTALSGLIAGKKDSEAVFRIPAALAGLLMILSFRNFLSLLTKDRIIPFTGSLILTTSLVVIDLSRRGHWDIYCHSFMMTAILLLTKGVKEERDGRRFFFLGGIFMGCSFMSKGPVAYYALLLPFMASYALSFDTDVLKKKWKHILMAVLFSLAIGLIWPLSISYFHPELSQLVTQKESSAWFDRHVQPFYFYLQFPLYGGLWAPLVTAGLLPRFAPARIKRFGSYRFILLWLLLSLFLISVIPEKKERYLLPVSIPMAMLSAYLFRSIIQRIRTDEFSIGDRLLLNVLTFCFLLIILSIPLILLVFGSKIPQISLRVYTSLLVMSVITALSVCFFLLERKIIPFFMMIIFSISLFAFLILPILPSSSLLIKNTEHLNLKKIQRISEINSLEYYSTVPLNPKYLWKIGKAVNPWDFNTPIAGYPKREMVMITPSEEQDGIIMRYKDLYDAKTFGCFKYDPNNTRREYCVTKFTPISDGVNRLK